MGNEKYLIPFTKGDARINRNGRPKNFDTLRHLAKELFKEIAETNQDGTEITKIEAIFRDWMDSKNFHKQLAAVQYAYGKVPDKLDVTREGNRIIVEWEDAVDAEGQIDAEVPSSKLKAKDLEEGNYLEELDEPHEDNDLQDDTEVA